MKGNSNRIILILIGIILGVGGMYLASNYTIQKKESGKTKESTNYSRTKNSSSESKNENIAGEIDELTEENKVIQFVKEHHELPDYYITKSEAKKQGWVPSKGNLCEVLPGRAIGGDHFSNREKTLPKNTQYYEADVNYNCGNRNADRIVFTKNGDVYLTKDHYKTFEEK